MVNSVTFTRRIPWAFVAGPWILVFIFWQMNLTYFSEGNLLLVALLIGTFLGPFLLIDCVLYLFFSKSKKKAEIFLGRSVVYLSGMGRLESKVTYMFAAFLLIYGCETLVFGFVPLLSMIRGEDVGEFDFGIPGLHGFLYSLGAATATSSYLVYKTTGKNRFLFIIVAVLVVFALLVTRKMMIFVFMQLVILEYLVSGSRKLLMGIFGAILFVTYLVCSAIFVQAGI